MGDKVNSKMLHVNASQSKKNWNNNKMKSKERIRLSKELKKIGAFEIFCNGISL